MSQRTNRNFSGGDSPDQKKLLSELVEIVDDWIDDINKEKERLSREELKADLLFIRNNCNFIIDEYCGGKTMTETANKLDEPEYLRSKFEEGLEILKQYNPNQDFYDFITEYDCDTHEKLAYVLGHMNMDLLNAIATRSLANKAMLADERGDIV